MRGSGRMFFLTTIETSETLLAPFAFWLKPFRLYRLVFIVVVLLPVHHLCGRSVATVNCRASRAVVDE